MNRARWVSLMLAVSLALTAAAPLVLANEWDNLREQRGEYSTEADRLRQEQQAVLGELFVLNRNLQGVEAEIARLDQDIRAAEQEQIRLLAELSVLRRRYDERRVLLAVRLRFMYEDGMVSYLEVLLGATDFADFLGRLEILSTIVELDRKLLGELRTLSADVARQEESVRRSREVLADLRQSRVAQRQRLTELIAAREERLAGLKERRAAVEGALADLEQVWEQQARPALAQFGSGFHTLSLQLDQVTPDDVQLDLPFGVTVVLTAETLNSFIVRLPDFSGLRFRLLPGSADVVGTFAGVDLEVLGTFAVASNTTMRYVPREIRFFGVTLPESVTRDLVQSGQLDVDLRNLLDTWRLKEITVEDGRVLGKAGR